MQSVLNKTVSGFADTWSKEPKPINLLTWLTSDKYRPQVEKVRQAETKEERTALKMKLPCITISGQFRERNSTGLVQYSGLICLDIDSKENEFTDMARVKKHLSTLPYVAYVGFSVSGNGLFCIVPIGTPERHKGHFKALVKRLERFGLTVDKSGSDICRLRYYSYDSEPYFNHEAATYTAVYTEPEKPKTPQRYTTTTTATEPVKIITRIVERSLDGEKHCRLYKAARLAGGFIAANKLTAREAIEALETAIQKKNIVSFELAQTTIRDGIVNGIEAGYKEPES
jgi:hypothetical protein